VALSKGEGVKLLEVDKTALVYALIIYFHLEIVILLSLENEPAFLAHFEGDTVLLAWTIYHTTAFHKVKHHVLRLWHLSLWIKFELIYPKPLRDY